MRPAAIGGGGDGDEELHEEEYEVMRPLMPALSDNSFHIVKPDLQFVYRRT